MPCVHLQQLFKLCHDQEIKLASSDLIHIVCTQCGEQEVCPSMLTDEYDARHPHSGETPVELAPPTQ
ncbi:MAG: hypothetical protein AB7G28_23085 [Pirellulales bacterium]